jgi:serine phosphatase RsbU (regulator of sigma subunit)
MLGKEPILNAIRQNSSSDATQIIDAIFDILDKFIGEVKIEDDITSVVIKMHGLTKQVKKSDKLYKIIQI